MAAFVAQQAVEKHLKATWMLRKREAPPRTHSLTELGDGLSAPAEVRKHLVYLNPDYTTARYPDAANGVPYEVYDRATAEAKVAAAEEVFRGIRWLDRPVRVTEDCDIRLGVELLCYTPDEYAPKLQELGIVRTASEEGLELLSVATP